MPADYRTRSFWLDELADDLEPREPLPGDIDADVAIVGAGLTGLWAAYYLAKADPSLRIVVLERDIAGYGASGRNGGWCSAYFPVTRATLAAEHGTSVAADIQRAMFATVDEVGRVCAEESIDADFVKAGSLAVCTTQVQAERQRASVEEARAQGFGEEDIRWLTAAEAAERVATAGCVGAEYTPHNATLQPAKLTRGLANVVESLGVRVYERTTVTAIEPGIVRTDRGSVRAEISVRALEGYTATVAGHDRLVLPVQIFMVATEPLPDAFWDEVGWRQRECVNDARRLFIYAQRTADGRIAAGGGGATYHFGSGTEEGPPVVGFHEEIRRQLVALWPGMADAAITHRWGGYMGVSRDWYPSVGFRRESGLAWAGGYVGDGVPAANLAGRTLRDLILGRDTDLVHLPWVNHRWRRWEPEPLRWLGASLGFQTMVRFDRTEARTGKTPRLSGVAERILGR